MPSDERFLLYASAPADYALLSWPEAMDGPRLVAVPGADSRSRISHPDKAAREMDRLGGLAVVVQSSGDTLRVVAKAYLAGRYQPPEAMLVLGSDALVERRALRPEGVFLKPSDFALIPVDLPSQRQLEAWLTGLDGLPGDLKLATIESIRQAGVFEGIARPAIQPAQQRSKTWLWIALAVIAGVSSGGAAGVWWGRSHVPHLTPPPPPAAPQASLSEPMQALEDSMEKSDDIKVKGLVESHVKPLSDSEPAARSTAEAWMLVKLALYGTDPQADLSWTAASNQKVAQQFQQQKDNLDPALQSAVSGVACAAGKATAAAILGSQDCSKVDWKAAAQGLAALVTPPPAPPEEPPNAKTNPPQTKTTAKTTVKSTGKTTKTGSQH